MNALLTTDLGVLAGMALVMSASWLTQRAARNAGWTDVFWTFGTGVSLATAALMTPGGAVWRRLLVAVLVGAWALRLGSHIVRRVLAWPEDARYAQSRRDWGPAFQRNMLGLSLIQAPASALLALSVILAAAAPRDTFGLTDAAGLAVWLGAVVGETLADNQLRRFRTDPANRGRICETGLWAWSRHPNYVFEALGWWAYPVMALKTSEPLTWLTLAAPVVMFMLLRFVSGVPPLEAAMVRSRGDAWRAYSARVSPFFFRPPRRASP